MIKVLTEWSKRTFEDPEVSILLLTLLSAVGFFFFLGEVLAPIIASIILAYILDGFVTYLHQRKCPHLLAIAVVFLVCISFFLACLLWLFPLVWRETTALVQALPNIANQAQKWIATLPEHYPDLVSHDQIIQITSMIHAEIAKLGKALLSSSVAIIPGLFGAVIYMVVVPFLVFFFLKDGHLIFAWVSNYFPKNRRLVRQVWFEVDGQMARYVRGKLIEIILISFVGAFTFAFWGLDYAILLGIMVGLSTLVPYVGAVVVSVPVVILVLMQLGASDQSLYLLSAYALIHLLDAQLLVPLLFSEALKLHPIAIFVAVMVFGGLWGFWGVFFAIPLATVVKAILSAWPSDPALL